MWALLMSFSTYRHPLNPLDLFDHNKQSVQCFNRTTSLPILHDVIYNDDTNCLMATGLLN